MKCSEIMEVCRELAPEDCAYDRDDPDLLADRSDREVREIYITLDAMDKVMEAAAASGADMLLTYHPLIFKATKKVNDQGFITRGLVKLIQADISYYAMYTNFDAISGCMADSVAKRLGLSDYVPLGAPGEMDGPGSAVSYDIDKSEVLKEGVTVKELVIRVKDVFSLPFALVYGDELMDQKVSRISVYPGVEGSEVGEALAWGVQVLVTEDINHHQRTDVTARGMATIDGGHYGLERIFIPYMIKFLRKNLGSRAELEQALSQWPTVIV